MTCMTIWIAIRTVLKKLPDNRGIAFRYSLIDWSITVMVTLVDFKALSKQARHNLRVFLDSDEKHVLLFVVRIVRDEMNICPTLNHDFNQLWLAPLAHAYED